MNFVYMMGFDVWGEGASELAYLAGCRASPKYARGTWHVLENDEGVVVSSLIVYHLELVVGRPAFGIGSVATLPSARRLGHASRLIAGVVQSMGADALVFLHADVDPALYERLGFEVLPERLQTHADSVAMLHASREARTAYFAHPTTSALRYF